jgi:periplasmic protein TonB
MIDPVGAKWMPLLALSLFTLVPPEIVLGQSIPLPPPPPPARSALERRPTPRNDVLKWITRKDYPKAALATRDEGVTIFAIHINAAGKITECTVTRSSGSAILDQTTCALLTRRAKFNPARGPDGQPVPSVWRSRFVWRPPAD